MRFQETPDENRFGIKLTTDRERYMRGWSTAQCNLEVKHPPKHRSVVVYAEKRLHLKKTLVFLRMWHYDTQLACMEVSSISESSSVAETHQNVLGFGAGSNTVI